MAAIIKKFAKAPAEKLDYAVDYYKELSRLADTVASSIWIVPSNMADVPGNEAIHLDDGVTVDYSETSPSPTFSQGGTLYTATRAVIYLFGGILTKEYIVENRITTVGGRKYARRIKIVIQDKTS